METEGFGIICDRDGRKQRFANFAFPKWMKMEVCKIYISITDGNGGFADFAFPKWTETEVCRFSLMGIDGNGSLQILLDGNGRKQSFCFRPFPSSPFSIFRFPCHPLWPHMLKSCRGVCR